MLPSMADSSQGKSIRLRRSRKGCRECRRRHRRCDEARPACSYCAGAGIGCEYFRELSWGGRPFKKSRFGQCLGHESGVVRVGSEPATATVQTQKRLDYETNRMNRESLQGQFVYAISSAPARPNAPSESERSNPQETKETGADNAELVNSQPPDPSLDEGLGSWDLTGPQMIRYSPELYPLSTRLRNLLGYFQCRTSPSLSCHEGIQHNICSALIPMAMSSPHLMAAILCAAASHRLSVGLERLEDVIRLHAVALQRLNVALASPDPHDSMTALGSSLVFCMSEIVLPEATAGDWRVHLSGASALLKRLNGCSQASEPSMRFMQRFYTSLKVIAAGCGISDGEHNFNEASMKNEDYIDDLAGFSTALVPIFKSISDIDKMAASQQSSYGNEDQSILAVEVLPQCLQLIERVRSMLSFRHLRFRPELSASLPVRTRADFGLLDEAYHHMALLQLYERSKAHHARFADAAQESVEHIISCISSMNIATCPCPGVATLPPLFAAGCSATDEHDRTQILNLLLHVRACFGMGNVTSTCRFLEARWAASKGKRVLTRRDVDGLDFLPY